MTQTSTTTRLRSKKLSAVAEKKPEEVALAPKSHRAEIMELLFCVGGIYLSFITWAILQERISTTPYGADGKVFDGSLVINTIQSLFAAAVGFLYVKYKQKPNERDEALHDPKVWKQITIVALSQSISSPFSYASLKYVNYITLLLAKSCKLLPLMAIHLLFYRRTYPLYKYAVVGTITAGVILFTYCKAPSSGKASAASTASAPSFIGLGLLGINLLLDGVTNSTQDHIFHTNKKITGPHMMFGLNTMSTILTALYLISPFTNQLSTSIAFIQAHPKVLNDILLFALCGGLGQVFIFHTLERYGAIILVTVTVTRKMMSMLLSVVWFNHKLTAGQWLGVFSVFGGIGFEAYLKYREKKQTAKGGKKAV